MSLKIIVLSAAALFMSGFARASTGYNQPPKEILDVMLAPATPMPIVSPTKDRLFLISMQNYPSIERVAEPYLRLAGVRVEP
ncbi:MAG TPA: hypothetical protein VN132_15670, partial [Bdellovibrio sp.]|nr:hypothetical protein [Bdellovibrio sp.]